MVINMRNIWMLAFANIRKNKSQSISLFLFVLIAAMFMDIGMVLLFGVPRLFNERAEANHAPHYSIMYQAGADAIDQGARYMEGDPRVEEVERIGMISGFGNYDINGLEDTGFLFMSRMDANQKTDVPNLVGEYGPLTGDAIYLPYFMFLSGGFTTGDTFKMTLYGERLEFAVAGTTEEITFGSQMNTVFRFYISDEKYEELERQLPEGSTVSLFVRLKKGYDADFFVADYDKAVSTDGMLIGISRTGAETSRTIIPVIAAAIMAAFSVILLIVSLIVIRFRINNSIEEGMTNIGVLGAVGYRSIQIISSIVVQFAGVTFVGGIMGVALSQVAVRIIMDVLTPMIALSGTLGFDTVSATFTLLFILLAVWLIAFVSARKIYKLPPLIAFRSGIATHSFRRNAMPLDKSRSALDLALAMKRLLQGKRQAAAIIIITAALTLASVAVIAANFNMNEGKEDFAKTILGEMPDANFVLKDSDDGGAFIEMLRKRPEVRKAFGYEVGFTSLQVDGTVITATIVEDCSLLESKTLIQGRYPKHGNEIALGPAIMKVTGKTAGDMVMVKSGDSERQYIVTGVVQYINNGGFLGMMTDDGMRQLQPDYDFIAYNAYVNDGVDVEAFIKNVEADNGGIIASVINAQSRLESIMGTISGIFVAVTIGIVIVAAFVIILVLYLTIKTTILRRRREFGIQKAVGFTTVQLMNQMALSMTPVIIMGVALGAVAGYFGFNPMMGTLLGSMGIVRLNLPAPLDQTIIICLALVVLAHAVSMAIAWRIRKISAYMLVSE